MRVKCRCGRFVPISLYTHGDVDETGASLNLEETGKPKVIGDGKCDECERTVVVYALVYFPSE